MFEGTITNVGVVSVTPRATEGKKPVTYVRVVHTDWAVKDKDGKPMKTFVTITCFGPMATNAAKLVPGSKLNFKFKVQTNTRTTKSGDKVEDVAFVATTMEYVSTPKNKGETTESTATATESEPAVPETVEDQSNAAAGPAAYTASTTTTATADEVEEEEEMPF